MSSIDRIRKPGFVSFPIRRQSSEPLQPESGAAEFEQALDDYAEERIAQVQGAEEVLQTRIQNQEKEPQRQTPQKKSPSEEEETPQNDQEALVDLVI